MKHNSNRVLRTLAYNNSVRILFVDNTVLLRELCDPSLHILINTAYGRALSVSSLITGTLKDHQRLSIKLKFSIPAYSLSTDVDFNGNVRGYISDELLDISRTWNDQGSYNLYDMIGERGSIRITKDIGMSGTFTGITDMPFQNITDDIAHYYQQSEQIPTIFYNGIQFNQNNEISRSKGIMAQLLPGVPHQLLEDVKRTVSQYEEYIMNPVNDHNLLNCAETMFPDMKVMGSTKIQYHCDCSKEVLYPMLYSLDQDDLLAAVANQESIELVCHICGRKYKFDVDDISNLLKTF